MAVTYTKPPELRRSRRMRSTAALPVVLALLAVSVISSSFSGLSAKELETDLPYKLDGITQYAVFNFPSPAVAEILCAMPVKAKDGRLGVHWNRVMAQGPVRLPVNRSLSMNLRFDGLEKMAALDCLKQCQVRQFSAAALDFEDRHTAYIKVFKNLEVVDFNDTLITDASLPILASFPKMGALRLVKTNITGVGFDHLKDLKYLTELKLEGASIKPGMIFKLKSKMPQMINLNISRISITREDTAILKTLRDVKFLSLSTNTNINDETMKYLAGLDNLHTLTIDDTSVTEKSLPILLKLPGLRYVVVRDKTFWKSKNHKNKMGNVTFTDCQTTSNAPPDVFSPLH